MLSLCPTRNNFLRLQTLSVLETRSSDSGIYVCVATNEAGTAQQAYTLEVLGKSLFGIILSEIK